jgi:hypothetical protein
VEQVLFVKLLLTEDAVIDQAAEDLATEKPAGQEEKKTHLHQSESAESNLILDQSQNRSLDLGMFSRSRMNAPSRRNKLRVSSRNDASLWLEGHPFLRLSIQKSWVRFLQLAIVKRNQTSANISSLCKPRCNLLAARLRLRQIFRLLQATSRMEMDHQFKLVFQLPREL